MLSSETSKTAIKATSVRLYCLVVRANVVVGAGVGDFAENAPTTLLIRALII
jgi:hypothetical protein